MIYVILCILVNAGLILVFRLFPKYGIDSFQAVVMNYLVAAVLGYQIAPQSFEIPYIIQSGWMPWTILLGALFVSLFYLISVTTITFGVSVATVANKMSIAIPVSLAVYLYAEKISMLQIAGIVLAMTAVLFVSIKKGNSSIQIHKQWHYLLPVILFVGCGAIDALISFLQATYASVLENNEFILSTAFMFAFIIGAVWFALLMLSGKIKWHSKSVLTGLFLGVPNFFSMFLIMKSLESGVLNASTFFPVNNMSIVVVGTIVSVIAFKEKLNKFNVLGIFLSIVAIVLIAVL